MSLEIAWKQIMFVADFHLLRSLLVVFGLCSQAFICEFSRQNICSNLIKTYTDILPAQNDNCVSAYSQKQPNQVGSIEFLFSVYSTSTSFFLCLNLDRLILNLKQVDFFVGSLWLQYYSWNLGMLFCHDSKHIRSCLWRWPPIVFLIE